MKHIKKNKTAPNQSYDHMQGQITNPQDHPAYSVPDPTYVSNGPGQINPPGAITAPDGSVL